MLKFILLCPLLLALATSALKIHDFDHHEYSHHQQEHQEHQEHMEHHHEPEHAETEHHHDVEHKHATSHQSVKFHHYHAVPVYIKKEDQHLVKHPVEIGGTKHKLKIHHPETKHNHDHGLVLEEHSESKFHEQGEHHEHEPHHMEHYEHYHHDHHE